jgi:hypothetical protein
MAMTSSDDSARGLFAWGRYRVPTGAPLRIELGFLTVLARKEGDEIWISHRLAAKDSDPPETQPPREEWSRWGAPDHVDELEIFPSFPDRSLVLQPEDPFHLLPGARARIFVRVPLWVRVTAPGAKAATLLEIPTITLSDTWWGTPQEGQLCYWLHIMARREAAPSIFRPDRIVCPVDLINQAKEDLSVEKTLLRVDHLSIFRGSNTLWSDEIRVRYRGEDEGSEIEMTGRTPPEAPGAPRLTHPRTPLAKGFTARTFARLKAFPGLGTT